MRRRGIAAGLVLGLALVAFGLGRVERGDGDDTAVRTERVRDAGTATVAGPDGEPEVAAILARTAADGTLIRVIEERWQQGEAPPGEWTPPPSCFASAGLSIGLVTDEQVSQGWAEVFDDEPSGPELRGSGTAGYRSIGEIAFAAVRTGDPELLVQLVHDGAVVDETTPEAGWAIVAAQVPAAGTQVVYGDARRAIGEVDVRAQGPECQPPPPALPDDVTQASPEELAAFQAALDGVFARDADGDPIDPRPHLTDASLLTDDWLSDMRAAVASYTETGVEVEIAEAGVRDDGTGAAVYRLVGPPVGWQLAQLAIVDGEWKVATSSWCDIVGLVFSCP